MLALVSPLKSYVGHTGAPEIHGPVWGVKNPEMLPNGVVKSLPV